MIARVWKCRVSSENVQWYVDHFQAIVLPELHELADKGFQQAFILSHPLDDGFELTVMTLWDSMEVIRRFAGDNEDTAVTLPALDEITRSYDTTVSHSDVVFTVSGGA